MRNCLLKFTDLAGLNSIATFIISKFQDVIAFITTHGTQSSIPSPTALLSTTHGKSTCMPSSTSADSSNSSLRTQPIAASSRSTIWSGGNGLRWVPPS